MGVISETRKIITPVSLELEIREVMFSFT